MKTLLSFAFILFLAPFNSNAQEVKSQTIKVWGNCGMCKAKIEKSARSAGAQTAEWNEESKLLAVTFMDNKSSATKIQKAIAKSGYDTEDFTADVKVYNKLHHCCKYERKEATAQKVKCCDDEKCAGDGHLCDSTCSSDACKHTSGTSASCCVKAAGN